MNPGKRSLNHARIRRKLYPMAERMALAASPGATSEIAAAEVAFGLEVTNHGLDRERLRSSRLMMPKTPPFARRRRRGAGSRYHARGGACRHSAPDLVASEFLGDLNGGAQV
jgi:hypothetical protein